MSQSNCVGFKLICDLFYFLIILILSFCCLFWIYKRSFFIILMWNCIRQIKSFSKISKCVWRSKRLCCKKNIDICWFFLLFRLVQFTGGNTFCLKKVWETIIFICFSLSRTLICLNRGMMPDTSKIGGSTISYLIFIFSVICVRN